MSTGQKAWAEEQEAHAFEARCDKIRALHPEEIMRMLDAVSDCAVQLERHTKSMSRLGWYYLDKLKTLTTYR